MSCIQSYPHPDITDMAEMEIGKLLLPVREGCFHADDIHLIESALHSYYGDCYSRILLIHKFSSSLTLNGSLHGSVSSNHVDSSLVLVDWNSACKQAFVRKCFCNCNIKGQ